MTLTVGILHTFYSACACHRAIEAACTRFGYDCFRIDSEALPERLPPCDVVFELASGYHTFADWRWYPRQWAVAQGALVVGSSPAVVRLCDNKALAKQVMTDVGIPVPRGLVVGDPRDPAKLGQRLDRAGLSTWPLVVKPTVEHGSTGLSLAHTLEELAAAVERAIAATAGPALIEEYIDGAEFELSILEEWTGQPIPIIELAGLSGLYSSAKKAQATGEVRRQVASFNDTFATNLQRLARDAMSALGGRSFMRFDLRVVDGTPYFLEANAKPSFEKDFGLDFALQTVGLDVTDAANHLIQTTLRRAG